MVLKDVFREWPQDWFRVCAADIVVTGVGSWLFVLRSSYRQVGIRLFAVLTSSTWLSTLQLYGSDISNTGFTFFAVFVGLEKFGVLASVFLLSVCSLKTEDAEVAACVS